MLLDLQPPLSGSSRSSSPLPIIRAYPIRYLLMLLFISLSMTNAFQWIEYSIIEKIVTEFYQVNTTAVMCTSVVYMVSYIIGIIPATWLLDHYGLRPCLIIASLGNTVGSWIKCVAVDPNLFWVSMLGQTIVASSQLFILNIPPLLAATWFPANDVATATSYGVFGNQVGIALGFFIPPLLVPAPEQFTPNNTNATLSWEFINTSTVAFVSDELDRTRTARGFRFLFYSVSIITTVIFLLIVGLFENRPKHPPSEAQVYAQTIAENRPFTSSIVALFTNCNFVLLFISYGLNTGVFYAISTVLGHMVNKAMGEKFEQEAGWMGMIITLAGIIGSLVCGYILAYSKRFKCVTLFVYIFSLLGTIAFTIGIEVRLIWLLMAICALLGFFMTGYLPIGLEFAAEVSFPQPEGTSAGLLNASAQVNEQFIKNSTSFPI